MIVDVGHVLDLVTRFAATGRLGPLHCGMDLHQTQEVLGPFNERAQDRRPRRWRPRLYFWDDLELLICHDTVVSIEIPLWRDTVQLPAVLDSVGKPRSALLLHRDVLGSLRDSGCDWYPNPKLVPGRENRGISTAASTDLMFSPDPRDDRLRLYRIGTTDFSRDPGPHPDRGPRPDPPSANGLLASAGRCP